MTTKTAFIGFCEVLNNRVFSNPQAHWPSEGVIKLENVVMSYRPDLRPALDGVDFQTAPGEKIGIVGRTGSGKSSLFNALLR